MVLPCVVLVGFVLSGDLSCSASSPGGNLVDGLPLAANTGAGVIGRGFGR